MYTCTCIDTYICMYRYIYITVVFLFTYIEYICIYNCYIAIYESIISEKLVYCEYVYNIGYLCINYIKVIGYILYMAFSLNIKK